jgi:hypothetical protein
MKLLQAWVTVHSPENSSGVALVAETGHHEQLSRREDVKPPSEKSFGITFAVVFSLLAVWLYWRKGLAWWPQALLAAAAFFLIAALVAPRILRPLNVVWLKFGLLLHRIVNPIVMGLLFFLVFTPAGLIMRLLGKDLLRLRREPNTKTYWIARSPETDPTSSMKNQF